MNASSARLVSPYTIALVGNPNSGKTTLFNALTGSHEAVGNWSRSTVEGKQGYFNVEGYHTHIVDLPGIYSLADIEEHGSKNTPIGLDEAITRQYVEESQFDALVNVVDANLLERHLYLTLQLLACKYPMVVVVNRIDLAKRRGLVIDIDKLSEQLGCPVVATDAKRGIGLDQLKAILLATRAQNAVRGDSTTGHTFAYKTMSLLQAQHYYKQVDDVLGNVVNQAHTSQGVASTIDRIVLSRLWGIPIFLLAMYILFVLAVDVGGIFQDCFDIASASLFVSGTAHFLAFLHAPAWLISLLADGVGRGINTVLTFVPVLAVLFFCLSWLEESGYMVRAAFVMDRAMRVIGLPGKSFVPMIMGFGCNVPSIMATRTLESPRERVVTIMMLPFMSCGARLAIYAVFTAAFFPGHGAAIIFLLYLIGVLIAALTGFVLKKTILPGRPHPMILELPCYQWPSMKMVLRQMWQRLSSFVNRAGILIIPVCLVMGVANTITLPNSLVPLASQAAPFHPSLLAYLGQWLTPLFAPMGIHADNWPATIGLLAGVLAKEVVVGSLNALYHTGSSMAAGMLTAGHLSSVTGGGSIVGGLHVALSSIKANVIQLPAAFLNPFASVVGGAQPLSASAYNKLASAFNGMAGIFAYLLFVSLYFPCISTTAVITRELNRGWACFSIAWSTGLAYAVAVSFYQLATLLDHPLTSALWLTGTWSVVSVVLVAMRYRAARLGEDMSAVGTQQGYCDSKAKKASFSSPGCVRGCVGCV